MFKHKKDSYPYVNKVRLLDISITIIYCIHPTDAGIDMQETKNNNVYNLLLLEDVSEST